MTKVDNDCKIVPSNNTSYNTKAQRLLSDTETYGKLNKNPLKIVAADFNRKVRKIVGNKKTIELLGKFKVVNTCLSNFYGLLIIHKTETPLNPIVSKGRSFSMKLSKWPSGSLSPLAGSVFFFFKFPH